MSRNSLFLALALLLSAGCAKAPVEVSGTVVLDSKPLANANLGFISVDGGGHGVATTNADGNFTLQLIPGEYKVTAVANPPPFDITKEREYKKALAAGSPISPTYSDANTTPLRLTIPSQAPARLELKSRP
jgi:hypothetical protein